MPKDHCGDCKLYGPDETRWYCIKCDVWFCGYQVASRGYTAAEILAGGVITDGPWYCIECDGEVSCARMR